MKKKIKTKEFSETNKDDNKSKTPILMSKNKATLTIINETSKFL